MAFKTANSEDSVPDSPDKLFRDLTRRKFPDVLPHQAETMQAYAAQGVTPPDVALQLPTGGGKTLVNPDDPAAVSRDLPTPASQSQPQACAR